MGNHRMFANTIIDSDLFLEMPLSTQALYFHLGMRADDEGFINNPKKIIRSVSCTEDDLKLLVAKGFIISFDSGIIVIAHWNIHNSIRKDRKKDTFFQDEKALLEIDNKNVYMLCQPSDNHLATTCQPSVNQMSAQGKLSKDKLSEDKLNKDNIYIVEQDSTVYSFEILEIVEYLNEQLGTSYRSNTNATRKHIIARLKEGYTVEDFKKVIDLKIKEWRNTDMSKYLRPETLFGAKFESYLNSPVKDDNLFRGYEVLN